MKNEKVLSQRTWEAKWESRKAFCGSYVVCVNTVRIMVVNGLIRGNILGIYK